MTANDDLLAGGISHAIGVQRAGAWIASLFVERLSSTEEEILSILAMEFAFTPRYDQSAESFQRVNRSLALVRSKSKQVETRLTASLVTDVTKYIDREIDFQVNSLSRYMDVEQPSKRIIVSKFYKTPIVRFPFSQEMDRLFTSRYELIAAQVWGWTQAGSGSIPDLMVRIRGTAASRYRDGLLYRSRIFANSLARSVIDHAAVVAQEGVFAANSSMLSGVIWVPVLDSNTTPICQQRAWNVYPIGVGPRPPAHYRCRSIIVPVLKGVDLPSRRIK